MDGDDDSRSLGEPARFEEAGIGRVAVIDVVVVAAVARDGRCVGIGSDIGNAVFAQQRAYALADATIADDDRMALSGGGTRGQFAVRGLGRPQPSGEIAPA